MKKNQNPGPTSGRITVREWSGDVGHRNESHRGGSMLTIANNTLTVRFFKRTSTFLLVAVVWIFAGEAFADDYDLRVVYADVPGTSKLEAGQIEAGVELLEARLNDLSDRPAREQASDIMATLCAAYIISRSFDRAERPCNQAVERAPSFTALNNRAIYRAFTGDIAGARDDLDRARPARLEAYIKELAERDPRVVAAYNFGLIEQLLANRRGESMDTATASIEELEKKFQR
jgi:hypothetical protein